MTQQKFRVLNRRSVWLVFSLVVAQFCGGCATPAAQPQAAATAAEPSRAAASKPAATDLLLSEFYRMPIGPRGLEPTGKLLSLNGQRVRIRGFIVQEEEPTPGLFMLAARPVQLAETADGPADDLPGALVFVHLPADRADHIAEHRRGPIAVEGLLALGGQQEPNQRISYVRLQMDDLLIETPVAASR